MYAGSGKGCGADEEVVRLASSSGAIDREREAGRGLRSPVMTAPLVDRALSLGADQRDTADDRFRKRLLVGVALVILPVALLWGLLYWLVGEQEVALTPWAYAAGSAEI